MSTYEDMVSVLTDFATNYPDNYNRAVREVSSTPTYTEQAEQKLSDLQWRLATLNIARGLKKLVTFALDEGIEFTIEELHAFTNSPLYWVKTNKQTIIDRLVESLRIRADNV